MRYALPLEQAYKVLNHGPVTLVTTAHAGQRNVMAAAWAMPLDFSPPKVAVVIDRNTYSRQLLEAAGSFVLNIPGRGIADKVLAAGSVAGEQGGDKLTALGFTSQPASLVEAPLLDGCCAWLECRVLPEEGVQQRYDLFLAEVVAAWADDQAYVDGRWTFADPALRTLHYIAGGNFFATDETITVA